VRQFASIKCSIWEDEDYLKLPDWAKLLYQFLLEQADLALCDAIPLREGRRGRALGFAPRDTLEALEQARYIVVDRDHEELWVRTFMRHGQVCGKGLQGAQDSLDSVRSPKIRAALAHEYPILASEWDVETSDPIPHPITDPIDAIRDMGDGILETRDLDPISTPLASHPSPDGVGLSLTRDPTDDDRRKASAPGTAPRSAPKPRSERPSVGGPWEAPRSTASSAAPPPSKGGVSSPARPGPSVTGAQRPQRDPAQ